MKVDNVVKNALLEAMDEFHRICEENNLQYYLIGGSLIGAIRHKGCIPWDDDIDVIMFKSDFKKLLKLEKNFSDEFKLSYRLLSKSKMQPVAKLENLNVIIDEGHFSGNTSGVFIDVFCFEDTFNSSFLQKIHFFCVKFFRLLIQFKTKSYLKEKYSIIQLLFFFFIGLIINFIPNTVLNFFLSVSENMAYLSVSKGKVANLHGVWKLKEVVPKQIFEKRKLYDFEGRRYWSLEEADLWLKPIYGNYMELPPESDRKPKHIDKLVSVNGTNLNTLE